MNHAITQWVQQTATMLGLSGTPPEIEERRTAHTLAIQVVPAAADARSLIGFRGETINLLRQLAYVAGERSGLAVTIEVITSRTRNRPNGVPAEPLQGDRDGLPPGRRVTTAPHE